MSDQDNQFEFDLEDPGVNKPNHGYVTLPKGTTLNNRPGYVAEKKEENLTEGNGTFSLERMYPLWQGLPDPAIVRCQESQIETKFCQHEPIDVGFARQKLVCKKCDKEL